MEALFIFTWSFNTPLLGAVKTWGRGGFVPPHTHIFKEKSSIPRRSAAGIFYFKMA
jgi:hypothetical protein